ncbi:Wzz/FepE/Etk N-terminal domain-containing protein [Devosia sp.]|uniref:tyrosine-protein kinase domain-containing protein n=1 Tax=Devosia sp. TaxID=1871048 RepID=UPI001B17E0D4|nr:Wzz/FepE/Etk N-terminal domain-containing protein [Devosia sp.]MBO9589012.1 AAA family ATPase [Devosia sp.]
MAGEVVLIIPRAEAEAFLGVLVRHGRLIVFITLVAILGALFATSALRPIYTATALLVVEPAPNNLLASGSGPLGETPNSGAVDGMVEIMRSDPVMLRAMELASPFELADFSSGFDLQPMFLGFFRIAAEPLAEGEAGRAQVLGLMRNSVSINRRGLTPIIAIRANATSPEFAARLANALGEAHIALEVAAKSENLRKARDLIEGQVETARGHVLALSAALGSLKGASATAPSGISVDFQSQIVATAQSLELARNQYQRLLQRSGELEEQAELQLPDARLVAPASPPSDAGFPDMKTTLTVAALLGVVVALALAFTFDGLASGVRSTDELAEAIGVPAAVAMPRLSASRFDGTSHADNVITAPLSPFSEGMRTLQVNLQRSLVSEPGGQVVFVLSAGDGEGKTTTALGLARAFDAAGRSVLLLDADVRSAALHRHVDVPLAGGFEQVLAGDVDIRQLASMVRKDPLSNLSVLVNSDRSVVPAEVLFGGPTFANVLRGVRASYDITIVDMPSLHWSAEAAYILPHADAVVLVASWGKTERAKLREALVAIRQAHPLPVPLVPVLALQPNVLRWPAPRYEPGYSSR